MDKHLQLQDSFQYSSSLYICGAVCIKSVERILIRLKKKKIIPSKPILYMLNFKSLILFYFFYFISHNILLKASFYHKFIKAQ